MLANINGQILPMAQAKLPVSDHGLLYGYGLFITVRAYKGHLFLIDDHLLKLRTGLQELGIEFAGGVKKLEQEMTATLKANQMRNGAIRLTVTAGDNGWMKSNKPYSNPNFIIFTRKLSSKSDSPNKVLTVLNTPYHAPKVAYKTLSRLAFMLGKKEQRSKKADEGLFLTESGDVAEGISSNIFIVRKGVLLTPPTSTGIIAGVTRRFVIALAQKNGYEVKEQLFNLKVLSKADEVFLTNATQQIAPVICVDDIFQQNLGPVTKNLQKQYQLYISSLRSTAKLS